MSNFSGLGWRYDLVFSATLLPSPISLYLEKVFSGSHLVSMFPHIGQLLLCQNESKVEIKPICRISISIFEISCITQTTAFPYSKLTQKAVPHHNHKIMKHLQKPTQFTVQQKQCSLVSETILSSIFKFCLKICSKITDLETSSTLQLYIWGCTLLSSLFNILSKREVNFIKTVIINKNFKFMFLMKIVNSLRSCVLCFLFSFLSK